MPVFSGTQVLPVWHHDTVLTEWEHGQGFTIQDALTGVICFGATGSGKTSGPAKHLANAYLKHQFAGLVLCAKKEERVQWEEWAERNNRWNRETQTGDLRIVRPGSGVLLNFLNWERERAGAGAGHTINLVAMLDEITGAISGNTEAAQGDNKFFEDALHLMNTNAVDLPLLADIPISLPLLRAIITSAPQTAPEAKDLKWQQVSACYAMVQAALKASEGKDDEITADMEEVRAYWLEEFPTLSEKTRSIITLMFSMMARPLITRPLRRLFSGETTITPEQCFKEGLIVIVDLPVQEFGLVGRAAAQVWKYCWQKAILRRKIPTKKDVYLRPVFTWADECQVFATKGDSDFQAVARSAAGCTVYLTQNLESLRKVLGSSDAVQSLLGNLQAKFFAQNSGETNEWASKQVFGEHWVEQRSRGMSLGSEASPDDKGPNSSQNTSLVRRAILEPAFFTTLKRGGPRNNFKVECVVYKGGHKFPNLNPESGVKGDFLPYMLLTFNQLNQ